MSTKKIDYKAKRESNLICFIYDIEERFKDILEKDETSDIDKLDEFTYELNNLLKDVGLKRCSCCETIQPENRFSKRDEQQCLDNCVNGECHECND